MKAFCKLESSLIIREEFLKDPVIDINKAVRDAVYIFMYLPTTVNFHFHPCDTDLKIGISVIKISLHF